MSDCSSGSLTPVTPAAVWRTLLDGNTRFVAGAPQHPRQDAESRTATASGQYPLAAIFGCSDSRLAAELIFDLGLGDAFVVRNAGQVTSTSVIGSLEYAVDALGVHLILVLGHDECGAVRAAIDYSQNPNATTLTGAVAELIRPIIPAVHRVAETRDAKTPGHGTHNNGAVDVNEVGREHLRDTVADIIAKSELIRTRINTGILGIVGATYRLREGSVTADTLFGVGQEDSISAA